MCLLYHFKISPFSITSSGFFQTVNSNLPLNDTHDLRANQRVRLGRRENVLLNNYSSRLSESEGFDSINNVPNVSHQNFQLIEEERFLDVELFNWLKRWLRELLEVNLRDVIRHIKRFNLIGMNKMNCLLHEQQNQFDNEQFSSRLDSSLVARLPDQLGATENQDYHGSTSRTCSREQYQKRGEVHNKIWQVLWFAKIFNAFLVIFHSLLIIKAIDFTLMSRVWIQNRESEVENLKSVPLCIDNAQLDVSRSTSESYDIKKIEDNCYLFTGVAILNLLNNLYWHHYTLAFSRLTDQIDNVNIQMNKTSWLKSLIYIVKSPRHMFQGVYIALVVAGPMNEQMTVITCVYNNFNQTMRHAYNWYRVTCYLRRLTTREKVPLECHTSCRAEVVGYKDGWLNWPAELNRCKCQFADSFAYHFEKFHVMSQIVSLKLTLFTILVIIDTQQVQLGNLSSAKSIILAAGLLNCFLAMYYYYDKYFIRYLDPNYLLK